MKKIPLIRLYIAVMNQWDFSFLTLIKIYMICFLHKIHIIVSLFAYLEWFYKVNFIYLYDWNDTYKDL